MIFAKPSSFVSLKIMRSLKYTLLTTIEEALLNAFKWESVFLIVMSSVYSCIVFDI